MKPLKGIQTLAIWLMRIAMLTFAYSSSFSIAKTLAIKSINFYVAATILIFGLFILIGGFLSKHTMTMLSAILLLFAASYKIIVNFSLDLNNSIAPYFLLASMAVFFISVGNKK